MIGESFGDLIVIKRAGSIGKNSAWLCECKCGETSIVRRDNLLSGNTSSCGCKEMTFETTHGMSSTITYKSYSSMLHRCCNENYTGYRYWGGRGIAVCDEWKESFENFYNDMGERPSTEYSIDRIDNDGMYCKDNCRWATHIEQANNRSNNV